MPEPSPKDASEVDPERRRLVDSARRVWIDALIDLSRRNNLLHFRHLKTGTLELGLDDGESLSALLAGRDVPLRSLCPAMDEAALAGKVTEIRRRAQVNEEERGLETLYVALGSATWHSEDGGRPVDAPVLLLPVTIHVPGRDAGKAKLRHSGDLQVNLVLLHALGELHGCEIDTDHLLSAAENEDGEFDASKVYAHLMTGAADVRGFAVSHRALLGNFSFQKLAMVKDIESCGAELALHDVIAAIAGDVNARAAIGPKTEGFDPRELDRVPPDAEFLVLDADSSQMRTIASVLAGDHVLIQGPPGTGKSQTISNLIASLTAQGKSVLFVAEKRAALAAVFDRLERIGLGHIALDVHGADISRKSVMKSLRERLGFLKSALPVDASELHARFTNRRERLNLHAREMHEPRAPSGRTVYRMQGRLLRLPESSRSNIRWRGPALDKLTEASFQAALDLLKEAGANVDLIFGTNRSPWAGARIVDGTLAEKLLDAATSLHSEHVPKLLASLSAACDSTGISPPENPSQVSDLLVLLADVERVLATYRVDLFTEDLASLARELEPAGSGTLARGIAWLSSADFRAACKKLESLRAAGSTSSVSLLSEVKDAADVIRRWRSASTLPVPVSVASGSAGSATLAGLQSEWNEVRARVRFLSEHLGHANLETSSLAELRDLLAALAGDTRTPFRIPRLLAIERGLGELGLTPVLALVREKKCAPDTWSAIVEHAWLSSCLERAWVELPDLAGFRGPGHDSFVDEFKITDRGRIALAAQRVKRAHAERAIAVMDRFPDQNQLVRREAAKESRHLSLRKLFAQAPDVLTALCPCWTASPLSVSQLFGNGEKYFDVVIFDEASQVLPEDAVPAIMRAHQLVVAGDRHQLPPTTFFSDGGSDIGNESTDGDELDDLPDTVGFESLLDLMSATSALHSDLRWHYRSRDEALIAFSNHHIYGDRLVTFPGPGGPPVLRHAQVTPIENRDVDEDSSPAEVRRVVELVLEHARTRPTESLGVITLGIKHAIRIENAVDAALAEQHDAGEFFDSQSLERFFVKNLERVQGDERDAIILTIGYGKDRAGNLLNRLGPINNQGGERRLNVAVTRARKRMTLVSSFGHHDMDPNRFHSPGAELLRLYLQYASSEGRNLGNQGPSTVPLNEFESDVAEALTSRGIDLIPQYGASAYRIDLVAQHPIKPGRFVLAIECDGASYHSAPTARDRDRLRQQHLEALGWRFHRIWSTDWFQRRSEEIDRALHAFEEAVDDADREDARREGANRDDGGPDAPSASTDSSNANRAPAASSSGAAPSPIRRLPKPRFVPGHPITEYPIEQLVPIVRWIRSDGVLRTHDEIMAELRNELGFSRRGHRIDAALRDAIDREQAAP